MVILTSVNRLLYSRPLSLLSGVVLKGQRMLLIDRYLLRQFLQIFVICFASLTGLYIVIDAFSNLDRFLGSGADESGLLASVCEFYAYRTLTFFDWTSGILAMVTAMFTVTWIQRHRELTALMAAGISKIRVLAPVLLAAVVVSLLAAANRELVIPRLRDELTAQASGTSFDAPQPLESCFDQETGIMLGGDSVIRGLRQIVNPAFIMPADLSEYGTNLVAAVATYQPPTAHQLGGYLLHDVKHPQRITERSTLRVEGREVIITPADADWLSKNQVFVVSNVTFDLLAAGSKWQEYASTAELIGTLARPTTDPGNGTRVLVHKRIVQPFADATLLLLGLPLVVARTNRSVFVAIGICMVIVTAFMLVVLSCQSLGAAGWLRPALAAWVPLILFLPVAAWTSESLYL